MNFAQWQRVIVVECIGFQQFGFQPPRLDAQSLARESLAPCGRRWMVMFVEYRPWWHHEEAGRPLAELSLDDTISIAFEGLVSQAAGLAVQLDGGVNITFYGSHHEQLSAGYRVTNNTGIGLEGLTISDAYFAGNVGANGGAGFELSVETTLASGIFFVHNQILGNPDAVVKSINLASVVYQDNLYAGPSNLPPTSGITPQLNPATSINTLGVHSIGLNPSATPITTIQSGLGPGEMLTFYSLGGSVAFGAGGNIDLMGASSIAVNGSITFIRSDLGGATWKPVAQWSPPSSPPAAQARADASLRPRSSQR